MSDPAPSAPALPDGIAIRRLTKVDDRAVRELSAVLIDCVASGASVGFMHPLAPDHAERFWRTIAAGVHAGERLLLVATDAAGICGTVQLILNLPENQPHRADLVKMLVHRRARRRGIGAALLRQAEVGALAERRTLLVLDAVTKGEASRLYESLGWVRAGDIPNYALMPDGALCSTTYYYRDLSARSGDAAAPRV